MCTFCGYEPYLSTYQQRKYTCATSFDKFVCVYVVIV
jgi:hypothetical protein